MALLKSIKHKESEENIYNSSNIIKSIYFEEKEHIIIKFVKHLKDGKTSGSTYHLSNFSKKMYEDFSKQESQGKYFNSVIAKDKTISVYGKYKLAEYEIKDLLEEQKKLI